MKRELLLKVLRQLSAGQKRTLGFLTLLLLAIAIVDTLSAACVSVMAAMFASPDAVAKLQIIQNMKEFDLLQPLVADQRAAILFAASLVAISIAIKNVLLGFKTYASSFYTNDIAGSIGERMLRKIYNTPYEWHLRHHSADLAYQMEYRIHISGYSGCILGIVVQLFTLMAFLIFLMVMYFQLSLFLIAVMGGISFLIIRFANPFVDRYYTSSVHFREDMNQNVTEAIRGIRDVQVADAQEFFLDRFRRDSKRYTTHDALANFWRGLPPFVLETTGSFAMLLAILFMLDFQAESYADILSAMALLVVTAWRVLPAVHGFVSGLVTVKHYEPYIQNLFDCYEDATRAGDVEESRPEAIPETRPRWEGMTISGLTFTYAGATQPTLEDIDFSLGARRTLGIVGGSGAGKSTLAECLLGILTPRAGTLRLGRLTTDLARICPLRSITGYVPQSPFFINGTVAQNVALGVEDRDIDREQVKRCCELAAVTEFLRERPEGIDTVLGEGASLLSGGQRQRVAIARALYRRPSVLLFDEATSALDHNNERSVMETIRGLSRDMAMIIIAHRLSTVSWCDQLLWLEGGRVRMLDKPEVVLSLYKAPESEVVEEDTGLSLEKQPIGR